MDKLSKFQDLENKKIEELKENTTRFKLMIMNVKQNQWRNLKINLDNQEIIIIIKIELSEEETNDKP